MAHTLAITPFVQNPLILLAGIIVLGVGAQWLAWRLRVPSILLLLVTGLLAGPITGVLDPERLLGPLVLPFASLLVSLVLFEGGLSLRFAEIAKARRVVLGLVTIGAAITGLGVTVAAHYVAGLSWPLAALLGAILVVTGPTVIGPLLQHIRPTGVGGPILKWESIVIDPIGALLAVVVFEFIRAEDLHHAGGATLAAVSWTLALGTLIGLAGAAVLVIVLRRYLVPDQLQNAVALALVLCAFALAEWRQEAAGLLAVTVMGVALANQRFVDVRHIAEFKENLRVLFLAILFILLAADLRLEDLRQLDWRSAAFVGCVLLLRPLSVIASCVGTDIPRRDAVFVASVAPRGIIAAAVSSIFAIHLRQAGFEQADILAPLTFAVILGTVTFYGLTAPPLARWLGVSEANPQGMLIVGAHPAARTIAKALREHGLRIVLVDSNRANVVAARLENFETFSGSILGDPALEDIDLAGVGRLLALTSNNSVNSLAAQRFAPLLGRANVYQIAPKPLQTGKPELGHGLQGRVLFHASLTLVELERRLALGATVKATKITEVYPLKRFKEENPGAVPLFLISRSRRVQVITPEEPLKITGEVTLISLVDAQPAEPVPHSPPAEPAATSAQAASPA